MIKRSLILIFVILIVDQILKYWIKTNLQIGEELPVIGNWFLLHFTENEGMAFGFKFAGNYGKLILSIFRIIAISAIGYYLWLLIKREENKVFIISIAMIFAGALGNMLDSAFYGLIFSDSNYSLAEFMPAEGGYAPFLYGKVVDMFYFPIIQGHYPEWFPFNAGRIFIFFRPVFNIADSAITVGVFLLIFSQQKGLFNKKEKAKILSE
jgi:signal peptidase II